VLIRCQLEVAFVDLRLMVSATFAGDPTKFADVASEVERASGLKLISKLSFNFRLEVHEQHPVNGVLSLAFLRL